MTRRTPLSATQVGKARHACARSTDTTSSPVSQDDRSRIKADVCSLWPPRGGDDADGRMPVVPRMQRLSGPAEAEAGRLLCLLLVRLRALSAEARASDAAKGLT